MRCLLLLLVTAAAGCAAASYLCCPGGGGLPGGRTCDDGSPLNLDNCSTAYFLDAAAEAEPLAVGDDGHLFFVASGIRIDEPPGKFCVTEMWPNGSVAGAVVCFPDEEDVGRTPGAVVSAYGVLLQVSVAFLVATLAIYLWLPPLRDRDGLCLSGYMGSLALGSFGLGLLQLTSHVISDFQCVFMAFFTYYWLLAAFFWLNIVAFNVWLGVTRRQVRLGGRALVAALLCYGWGSPLVFLCAALVAHHAPPHHHLLAPGFGERRCWFTTQHQSWSYFFGPVAVLLAVNMVLFLWAAVLLCRTEPSTATSPPHKTLRYRCQLYTKLSLIMGVTWLLEVISFATGTDGFTWLVADVLNCLQGVLIFLLVVVFRRRVRRLLLAHCPAAQRCFGIQPSPLSQAELPLEDEEDCDDTDVASDDANEFKAAHVRTNGHNK
ncbi:G-protein coupled receptor Mth2-like [Schistocerca americana]|uniref:G-protein coupled receptor Mth2-like n=1 Tax=Schistocerca americana TaxID=7009 RepID=UPI001F4F799D|nr:G-protein coupled receptor Mth2-like [Schistocerca americana]